MPEWLLCLTLPKSSRGTVLVPYVSFCILLFFTLAYIAALNRLMHNVPGPHDDRFYKFLARLEAEHNELGRNPYSGEGVQVGRGVLQDLPRPISSI
ncbi:hypothetical protein BS47DRAFT_864937 [Hydnum rufescens UP504]|uniref:WLM domain-containing protein n=1 Tax=Hydnum rufescens UP504 TaxID=1448309 RepID=A0A9P6AYZ0_9AGAM|nr:hypothetical protein BS47DRAFT_864937 [Hydnum rufescens UP504]